VVKVETSGSKGVLVRLICGSRGTPLPTEHIKIVDHVALVVAALGSMSSGSSQVVRVGIIARFAQHRSGSVAHAVESFAARPPNTPFTPCRESAGCLAMTLTGGFAVMGLMVLIYCAHSSGIARVPNFIVAGEARETHCGIVKLMFSRASISPASFQGRVAPLPLEIWWLHIVGGSQPADTYRPLSHLVLQGSRREIVAASIRRGLHEGRCRGEWFEAAGVLA